MQAFLQDYRGRKKQERVNENTYQEPQRFRITWTGGSIIIDAITRIIPATRGIRNCAIREGICVTAKNKTTVRTESGMPITAHNMSRSIILPESKIGTTFFILMVKYKFSPALPYGQQPPGIIHSFSRFNTPVRMRNALTGNQQM